MANDYNAKLITELYSAKTIGKAVQISDEMKEIKDSIFPAQIYEAYKKYQGKSMGHYFISHLAQFCTAEADEILKKLAVEIDNEADIHMLIDRMVAISYFDPILTEKVTRYLHRELHNEEVNYYDVETYTSYLKNAGDLLKFEELLQAVFEDTKTDAPTKKSILKILLGIDAKKYLQYYFSNYNLIKGTRTEIVFVTEISIWKSGIIPQLHKLIIEKGSPSAKEIIEKKSCGMKLQLKKEKPEFSKQFKKLIQTRK